MIRPSQDLRRLAGDHEPRLPRAFRFLIRGWGTRESNADLLSLLTFDSSYLRRSIELGEADVEARRGEIGDLLRPRPRVETISTAGAALEAG